MAAKGVLQTNVPRTEFTEELSKIGCLGGKLFLTLFLPAGDERVADVTGRAAAHGVVIDNPASSVCSAGTGARIRAPLIYARFVQRTFRADQTFGSAVRGSSDIFLATGANGTAQLSSAYAVRTARRWNARIPRWRQRYVRDIGWRTTKI